MADLITFSLHLQACSAVPDVILFTPHLVVFCWHTLFLPFKESHLLTFMTTCIFLGRTAYEDIVVSGRCLSIKLVWAWYKGILGKWVHQRDSQTGPRRLAALTGCLNSASLGSFVGSKAFAGNNVWIHLSLGCWDNGVWVAQASPVCRTVGAAVSRLTALV